MTHTSYDIWCAGISQETFPVIGDDGPTYRKILDRTRFPHQEYAVGEIHGVDYPTEVQDRKIELLRRFNALVEGDEDLEPEGKSQ